MFKKTFILAATLGALALPVCANGIFDSGEQSVDIKPATSAPVVQVDTVESTSLKQAVSYIEQAQVVTRKDLAQYTAQYNEANARLVAAKAECKELKKHIKELNNKIKNSDRAKKYIGKNIPQAQEN